MKTPKRSYNYLHTEYVENNKSIGKIAEQCDTYPNAIRRELIAYGIPVRDKKEAQKAALDSGRHKHPTKGKKRPESTKEKIGNSVAKNWKTLTDAERLERSLISKKQWENMPETEKEYFRKKAAQSVRYASEHGSKLEQYLNVELKSKGYKVQFHKEGLIPNEKLQIDLYLPQLKTAIEIDGPTHFFPIWGEEKLLKKQQEDREKNGLLITNGFIVIRVKIVTKNTSKVFHRKTLEKILDALTFIEQGNILNVEDRLIEIE